MRFKLFIGSEQIEGEPVDSERMRRAVARFEKKPTFLFLSMLNNYLCLGSGYLPDDNSKLSSIAGTIFAALFNHETMQGIDTVWAVQAQHGNSVVILHRWQILGLMKLVILWGSESGLNPNSELEARFQLGKVCLMATSFLSPEPGGVTKDEIRAQLMPSFELNNPPKLFNAIARTYCYLKIASEVSLVGLAPLKLNDIFAKKYGISIFKYISLIYSAYATYEVLKFEPTRYFNQPEKLNISRSDYFKNLTFTEDELNILFNLAGIDLDDLLNNVEGGASIQYDFLNFRKYPLIRVSDKIYTCIDLEFLAEKLNVTNWFLAVRDSLPEAPDKPGLRDDKSFSSLNDTWGKEIFERYVGIILSSSGQPNNPNDFRLRNHKVIPQSSSATDVNKPRFDWGIFNANSLICRNELSWLIWLECKTTRLDIKSKYGNNPEKLTSKLLDVFKMSDGKNQIIRGIQTIIDGSASGLARLATIIYPVIIIEDELFGFEPIADLITDGFEKEKTGFLRTPKNFYVKPLTILTIETLEIIERYVAAGQFSLQEFLEFRSTTTSSDFHGILDDFIQLRGLSRIPASKRLNLLFDEFHEEFESFFRPEAYKGTS